jgi:large subunit ribosomal protein L22
MAEDTQARQVKDPLVRRIQALDEAGREKVVKTRSRRTKIRPEFVGHTLAIFNGHDYTKVQITQEMIGRTLAKVAPRDSATAQSRFLSIPPRKMRQVADLVQGLPVEKALNVLNFTPKIAAVHLAKTLKAAVANKLSLEGTSHLHPEDLRIRRVLVDAAPTAKRIRFQSMGRVFRLRKRFCHLSVFLEEGPEAEARAKIASTRDKQVKGKPVSKESKDTKKAARPKKKAAAEPRAKPPHAEGKGKSKMPGKKLTKGTPKAPGKGVKSSPKDR